MRAFEGGQAHVPVKSSSLTTHCAENVRKKYKMQENARNGEKSVGIDCMKIIILHNITTDVCFSLLSIK